MTSSNVIRLRILGVPGLDGADRDTASVLSQPKRLALLAYLSLRPGWVTRESLVELFWPELEGGAGRRALSQALHFLRRSLGQDLVRSRGVEELQLSRDAVDCDVDRFADAIGSRQWQAALAEYRGELLQGLPVEPSPAFSHWLEAERSRLEQQAGEAAVKQAKRCFEAGDVRSAVRFQARAVEIRPFDEAILREYLMLLDEIGDATTALATYEAFRVRLTAGYGLEPARGTARIVEMIRQRRPEAEPMLPSTGEAIGVRVNRDAVDGPIPVVRPETAGESAVVVRREAVGPEASWWLRRLGPRLSMLASGHPWPARLVIAVAVVFVAFLVTTAPLTTNGGAAIGKAPEFYAPNRVAVMYFDVAGDTSETADVGDYLTDEIIHRLSTVDTLQVVSSNGVRRFRRMDPPLDTIVKALHVGTIVTGRIVKFDNTTTILVQFADANGMATGGSSLHFRGIDVTAMVDSVAQVISENLRRKIGDDIELGRWRLSDNAEAGVSFARALSTDREFDRLSEQGPVLLQSRVASSIGQLELAMKLDPDWIDPLLLRSQLGWDMSFYCSIAPDCERSAVSWMQEAQDYANRALRLEPANSHALELRGRTSFYSWVFGFVQDPGVVEQARVDLELAVTGDERNAIAWKTLSAVRHELNDLQGAYDAARQALLADEFLRGRPEILWRLFDSAFELNMDAEAAQACRDIGDHPTDEWQNWQAAMCTLQLQAWSNERKVDLGLASDIVEPYLGKQRDIAGRNGPILGMGYAAVLARAGQRERARDVIRQMRIEATSQSMPETETALFEAAAWARLGDVDNAVDLAAAYLRANPSARRNTITRRWFRGEVAKRLAGQLLAQDGAPQLTANR